MATTTETQPQDIEATVIEALASFGADAEVLTRDATLESVDVDSLDLVELTQVVEERYEIDLDNADFKQIVTVGDVVDLVVARVSG
jgi:acyl carrier protein